MSSPDRRVLDNDELHEHGRDMGLLVFRADSDDELQPKNQLYTGRYPIGLYSDHAAGFREQRRLHAT